MNAGKCPDSDGFCVAGHMEYDAQVRLRNGSSGTGVLCRQALGSVLIHCKAPFGPKGADQGSTTVDAPAEDERPSLHDASSDLTGRLQELVHESRSAGSFQRGQLDLQVNCSWLWCHRIAVLCLFQCTLMLQAVVIQADE